MKYDFTTIMDRKGHDAIAVDTIPIPGVEVAEGFSAEQIARLTGLSVERVRQLAGERTAEH